MNQLWPYGSGNEVEVFQLYVQNGKSNLLFLFSVYLLNWQTSRSKWTAKDFQTAEFRHDAWNRLHFSDVSVFIICNAGWSLANIPLLAWASSLTLTFSGKVPPVVFNCLQLITSPWSKTLASTPTAAGMIESMLHSTLQWEVCFECGSSRSRHESVISGTQNVLVISIRWEW